MLPSWILHGYLIKHVLTTVLFVVGLMLLRWVAIRMLRTRGLSWPREVRRRRIGWVKNTFFVLLLFGLIVIWSEQVYAFAVSIFAIALAVVLAIRDLLECFNGSLMRMRSNSFDIGDRIEINGIRGDVIDMTLLSTTVLEVGPGDLSHQQTGRAITFPNRILLHHLVTNESYLHNVLLHSVAIPLRRDDDWRRAKELLLSIAEEECAPHLDEAQAHVKAMELKESVEFPSVEPRVSLHLKDHQRTDLVLRVPVPATLKGRIERNIIERFWEAFSTDNAGELLEDGMIAS